MNFDLTGKTAVVFGGTGGIGRGICLTMADHGADVIPVSRNIKNVMEVADEIESLGKRSCAEIVDACNPEEITAFRDRILGAFGKVDILVNSQGVSIRDHILEYKYETWREIDRFRPGAVSYPGECHRSRLV
ncbi:MAG TPA: SDR family NAD(P)-dependent oxidoreductase [Anaerovoracaceae bacterium]|nr:SDR family NAD(P)-dependent oxidoreductase [Anaerovoracaceae bacterium]